MDNSFCTNDETNNKNALIMACDNPRVQTKYVLNYAYGQIEDNLNGSGMVSACTQGMSTGGTYDLGSKPHVEIYNSCDVSGCKFGFIEMHLGVPPQETILPTDCGICQKYSGIVMDSWSIPELKVLDNISEFL